MSHLYDSAPVYTIIDNESHSTLDDSATSYGSSWSESSSGRSMSTLGSGEVADYFKELHGFQYIADENLPIVFPSDSRAERLHVVQHAIVKLCQQGRNVPDLVDEVIRNGGVGGTGARVLDIPTTSGTWVYEMAETYPSATFLSLDVRPLTAFEPHPRITSEVYDLYAGIAEPDASFDVVYARQTVTLIKDYNSLLREMHRVLKPGGVLVITEIPSQAYEANDPTMILRSVPRRAAGVQILRGFLQNQGIDLTAWETMAARLDPGHPMWANHALASSDKPDDSTFSRNIRGFHTVTHRTHLIPSGPWPADEGQRIIGALSRLLYTDVYRALLPLLLMMGTEEAQAQGIVDGLLEELLDPRYPMPSKDEIRQTLSTYLSAVLEARNTEEYRKARDHIVRILEQPFYEFLGPEILPVLLELNQLIDKMDEIDAINSREPSARRTQHLEASVE
ncbi:hypothetical protein FRC07_007601 [Ceratobasidium sp. 392]|nr:hypothetical protein FRC07_007601 [Ceratobasidium sp. 392]